MLSDFASANRFLSWALWNVDGKEPSGIQFAPLAKIGVPLTTKRNDSPKSSGSLTRSTVRKPMFVVAVSDPKHCLKHVKVRPRRRPREGGRHGNRPVAIDRVHREISAGPEEPVGDRPVAHPVGFDRESSRISRNGGSSPNAFQSVPCVLDEGYRSPNAARNQARPPIPSKHVLCLTNKSSFIEAACIFCEPFGPKICGSALAPDSCRALEVDSELVLTVEESPGNVDL